MQQYLDLLSRILNEGVHKGDRTGTGTLSVFGNQMRFDLRDGFPLLTTKKLHLKSIIYELLWFLRGDTNVHYLQEHGVRIWNEWADENGSIGKAYGYQLGVKHKYKEGMFDQVDRVLWQLKNEPSSRRIMTNIYNFEDLHEMGLYPCAYSMTFDVTDGKLNGILNQRSCDFIVANNWNVIQYAVLLHMFAQVSNLKVGTLVHVIANAHIYDRHFDIAKQLLDRPDYHPPQFVMDKSVKSFYDFTEDSFKLLNYQHGTVIRNIPVAI